ncbi:MAG: hypothetical protein IJU34_03570 [Bacteroidales bacterium]|nr:hypothetical protein [Bacteroidales bacterium]
MRRPLHLVLLTLLVLWSGSTLLAQEQDDELYWVLDRVETSRSEKIPYFTQSENSLTYNHVHDGHVEAQEPYSHYAKRTAEVNIHASWNVPNKIPYLKEDKVRIGWTLTSTPTFESQMDIYLMNVPSLWTISASIYTQHGVERSGVIYEPYWVFEKATVTPCYGNASGSFDTIHTDALQESMKYFLPDGSWTLIIEIQTDVSSQDGFGSSDPMSDTHYKNFFVASTRYYYRFHGQAFVEEENVKPASKTPGEDNGSDIPWEIFLIPPGAYVGWRVIKNRNKKKKKEEEEEEESDKPDDDEDEEEEEEEEERVSTYRMVIWKDFDDTLVLDDPPVKVGARIEEITPDGDPIDRPDLAKLISISGTIHAKVHSQKMEGIYMMGMVTAEREADGSCPDMAQVTFALNAPAGRFLNRIEFKVDDAATILVEPSITFAAGQGKTLFMEFYLYGAAESPEGLEVTLEEAGYEHFKAELEQSDQNPDLFRIHLTEFGEAKERAGTIESYDCTIRVQPRGERPEVTETFKINRIHLGLRVELRALKGFLVELESTPDHDFLPPIGNKRRLKPAESRVDMQLVVVDDSDPNHPGKIGPVKPDKGPVFKFEDDFRGSALFTDKPKGDAAGYVPSAGDLAMYENLFFRDFTGENVPSPCELLKFRYEFRDWMPDGAFYGVIVATGGFLVPPNRSFAKVTVTMTWHGQEFKEELRVPVNSQPYRIVDIPPGGDLMRALAKYDNEDLKRKENLIDLRRKIVMDRRFAELRPLFYKVAVMIEGHDKAFGFDDRDYENIMHIFKQFTSGEIGTYFAVKQTVSPDDETFDAVVATIATMDRSIPVIICRIGLAIVTGGVSEVVLTPISALAEMKEYVDKGGDSVWGGFAQISIKIIAMELLFAGLGKGFSKIKQWRADRAAKVQKLAAQTKKIGASAEKAAHNAKVNQAFGNRPGYSSASQADKVGSTAKKVKETLKNAQEMADDAIRSTGSSTGKQTGSLITSELRKKGAEAAKKDAQKILDDFRRVMNNPTATKEEMRRATLALQGNKTAQNLLRTNPSDMLRANYNAQMQQIYDELDPVVIKRLQQKIIAGGNRTQPPEIRVFKGATGNAGNDLQLGRKIGADRDVTYQFKGSDGKWYDLNEQLMEDAYSEAFNEMQYKFIPGDKLERLKTIIKADQAVVNGKFGLESYGDDLARIIDPSRQTEKLTDANRIAETYLYKCKEWLGRGQKAHETAEQLLKYGYEEEALHVLGYGEALIEEGVRQNVKQFNRILVPRIEAAVAKGAKLDYTKLMAKIRILEGLGNPPPKGVPSVTLEQARSILENKFGTTIENVVEECAQAVIDVNNSL